VLAEFREMPGLQPTLAQASCLFDIGPDRWERILGTLVDAVCVRTDGEVFIAAADGWRFA
jgi:hypothetical protein